MADRKPVIKMTTATGTFKWPKLTEPDYGSKMFPKENGEYSTKVVFNQDDAAFISMIEKLEPYHARAVAAGEAEFKALKVETRKKLGALTINPLYQVLYDQETEEPTGEVEMKFSMKAGGIIKKGPRQGKKWERKPQLFDARGKPMLKAPDIWGGTIGKISFTFTEDGYFIPGTGVCGISFSLEAVQVISLVSGGTRAASDYGFGEEEGDYEYVAPVVEEADEFADEALAAGDPDGAADF